MKRPDIGEILKILDESGDGPDLDDRTIRNLCEYAHLQEKNVIYLSVIAIIFGLGVICFGIFL